MALADRKMKERSALGSNYGKNIGLAAAIMMASVLLSRVIGLFREMVIAYVGGTGPSVDAYQVSFVIPEILNHIAASGFLSVTFIPIFSRYLAEGNESEGWDVLSAIFIGFGSLLVVLILICMAFAPLFVDLMAPGLTDPLVKIQAVTMTRVILPAQFFFFAGGLFMAVQFAKGHFAFPALAPLVYNIGIIMGGVLLGGRIGMEGFSWGALAGAFLGNFILQLWGALRSGLKIRIKVDMRHPDLRKYIWLTLPLMVGLTMIFSTEIFFKFFGSYLPEGSIAGLNYGLRIMLMLVGIFGQAVGVASFPFMARLVVEGKFAEMNRLLDRTLQHLSLVIPISVLCMVLRREIVILLFQRGRFDEAAVEVTAQALLFLLTGAFAFAAQTIVVRAYYAVQNTLFPAFFGTLAVVCSIPIYWAGMAFFGVGGVAFAVSISAILQVGLLYHLWNSRRQDSGYQQVYLSYSRMIGLGVIFFAVFEWVKDNGVPAMSFSPVIQSLLTSLLVASAFVFVFYVVCRLLHIPEIDTIGNIKKEKLFGG